MVGKVLMAAGLACLLVSSAQAQPEFDMCYDYVDIGGGTYEYTFHAELNDRWVAGMGWKWYIFGDQASAPTPLLNFKGDPASLPVGPWTAYSSSGGGHNGPTFSYVLDPWIPVSRDEVLDWKGTSTAALDPPAMLYSTLAGTVGGATPHNFSVAEKCVSKVDCEKIKKLKVKCRNNKLKGIVKSSLVEGTELTIDDNGEQTVVSTNAKGKAKMKKKHQTGGHTLFIVECPEFEGKVDCGD